VFVGANQTLLASLNPHSNEEFGSADDAFGDLQMVTATYNRREFERLLSEFGPLHLGKGF
jgi:hypothetical protein